VLVTGCIPSFDGLSGGAEDAAHTDAAQEVRRIDAASEHGATDVADATDAAEADVNEVEAPDDVATDADGPTCPSGRGPSMVRVPTIDGRSFCIDSTEVSQSQYAAFLEDKKGDTSGQPTICAWNVGYGPNCTAYDPTKTPNNPVACVDWCDAVAFCSWAGKRLCGKIGGGSLLGEAASFNDPTQGQKFAACSHGGTRKFPYGNSVDDTACAFTTSGVQDVQPVGTFPRCQGGYDGIFDITGNLQEWEDACRPATSGTDDVCMVRGGDFRDSAASWACTDTFPAGRTYGADWIGFRCCSD
jgi:formylglycine-generating enzyme required for sulfatase activity